jgi:hypothetical protein
VTHDYETANPNTVTAVLRAVIRGERIGHPPENRQAVIADLVTTLNVNPEVASRSLDLAGNPAGGEVPIKVGYCPPVDGGLAANGVLSGRIACRHRIRGVIR